jgi:CRP/FNR family transcriptional regulator, cyclic AMP receptor protein
MPDTSPPVFLFKSSEDSQSFARGDVIFKEGDPGAEMYAVQQGWVDLMVAGKVVETVDPGGIFGEMSLIDRAPRSATAIAGDSCKVVVIDEKRFNFMTQNTPNFALNVLRVISLRLRVMDRL